MVKSLKPLERTRATTIQRSNDSKIQRSNDPTIQRFNDPTIQRFNDSTILTLQRFNDESRPTPSRNRTRHRNLRSGSPDDPRALRSGLSPQLQAGHAVLSRPGPAQTAGQPLPELPLQIRHSARPVHVLRRANAVVRVAGRGTRSLVDSLLLRRAGILEGSAFHARARGVRWRGYVVPFAAGGGRARGYPHRHEGEAPVPPQGDMDGA